MVISGCVFCCCHSTVWDMSLRIFESVRWNAYLHRPDFGIYSHWKGCLRNGVRTHTNYKENTPLYRGRSHQRRCITHDSQPNTLPTELYPSLFDSSGLCYISNSLVHLACTISPIHWSIWLVLYLQFIGPSGLYYMYKFIGPSGLYYISNLLVHLACTISPIHWSIWLVLYLQFIGPSGLYYIFNLLVHLACTISSIYWSIWLVLYLQFIGPSGLHYISNVLVPLASSIVLV